MKLRIFEVTGHTEFPIDMLRHDFCYPARSEDVNVIIDSARNCHDRAIRTVRLRSTSEMIVNKGPTADRWSSFGWHVGTTQVIKI